MTEFPCKFDHNGECLVCDCWPSDCPFKKEASMNESEIEELLTLRDDLRKDAAQAQSTGERVYCNRIAERLDQAYALIRQLQERIREWPSN